MGDMGGQGLRWRRPNPFSGITGQIAGVEQGRPWFSRVSSRIAGIALGQGPGCGSPWWGPGRFSSARGSPHPGRMAHDDIFPCRPPGPPPWKMVHVAQGRRKTRGHARRPPGPSATQVSINAPGIYLSFPWLPPAQMHPGFVFWLFSINEDSFQVVSTQFLFHSFFSPLLEDRGKTLFYKKGFSPGTLS